MGKGMVSRKCRNWYQNEVDEEQWRSKGGAGGAVRTGRHFARGGKRAKILYYFETSN